MDQTLTGIIHGNTIVFDAPLAAPEGTRVEVVIRGREKPAPPLGGHGTNDEPPGWWNADDDRILNEIREARRHSTRSEVPE
jgi:hypothetical protein